MADREAAPARNVQKARGMADLAPPMLFGEQTSLEPVDVVGIAADGGLLDDGLAYWNSGPFLLLHL